MNQISHTQKIGHSRQALPFGAWPLSGAMLVFTQISSMNTDRRGSIRPQWRRRRSRRRFTSARSHLSATSVFLETEPAAAQKTSDSIVPHLIPALRQHLLQHGRRVPYPIQQPTPMRLQKRAAIPAHLRRPHRAGPRRAQSPLHNARRRNSKPLRSPVTALSSLHRGNNTFAKIIRVRSRHPYRPPSPVWILNHIQPSKRNPNPIHSKTEPASYHWPMGLTPLWISIWCRFRFTFIEGWRF